MKNHIYISVAVLLMTLIVSSHLWAVKKKVGQSGMTYLAISMGARESAMGDAATATVAGINGMWHNPAVTADIEHVGVALNQVNWMADTRLYGAALAYSLGNWGAIGVDVTYMDFGEIIGTRRVDKSVNYRGFVFTGDIGVEDYAIGISYARRINDKFALGLKVKRLHESLGNARYVYHVENEGTDQEIRHYREKLWSLDDWGLDFGTVYTVGWSGLTVAMSMQNLSRDLKYWYEEFSLPMCLRMGMAMDVADLFYGQTENLDVTVAMDVLHPNDYTERVHLGTEIVYMKRFAFRGGYKFNHDVESATFGVGLNFQFSGISAVLDYAYTDAAYFEDISRMTLQIVF